MPFSDMQITLGPPSLPSIGIIHQTSKSDLWHTLAFGEHKPEFVPDVDVKIVDGAVLVHLLDPNKSQEHCIKLSS